MGRVRGDIAESERLTQGVASAPVSQSRRARDAVPRPVQSGNRLVRGVEDARTGIDHRAAVGVEGASREDDRVVGALVPERVHRVVRSVVRRPLGTRPHRRENWLPLAIIGRGTAAEVVVLAGTRESVEARDRLPQVLDETGCQRESAGSRRDFRQMLSAMRCRDRRGSRHAERTMRPSGFAGNG